MASSSSFMASLGRYSVYVAPPDLPPAKKRGTRRYLARHGSPLPVAPNLTTSFQFHNTFNLSTTASCIPVSVPRALTREEEQFQTTVLDEVTDSGNGYSVDANKLVLVVGGTGGVGQLVVASLLNRNIRSLVLTRDPKKATSLFGVQNEDTLKIVTGDTRNPSDMNPAKFEGVTHVICCTGTTAFPSKRWNGDNTPEKVDWEGIRNLVSALMSRSIKRIVLVSSVGVTKYDELPWSIMNLFGVLKYKKMGEDFVRNSGIPFTIIRPGRLTDGPYTSYDLNTLLKATAGTRRAAVVGQGDRLVGEASRLVVAEACIQALDIDFTQGQTYEINSIEGEGPGEDCEKWMELFSGTSAKQPVT